jgi:hypothetical protein
MGYKVLGERDIRFQPRKGLEGPFYFATGRVLYYDPKAGEYWDPLTDFYVDREEVNELHEYMVKMLTK